VEIRVVDKKRNTLPEYTEGEEASRGPNVFVGYFDEPELTAQALDDEGWYYSGDYCRVDKAGYLKITGRKKTSLFAAVKISVAGKWKIFCCNILIFETPPSSRCQTSGWENVHVPMWY
jgi:non-ribosomal peptide synthetase component E (peptide arylation enzyme)